MIAAKSDGSCSAVLSDLTAKAAIAELPEELLIQVVMELTNGFHHPELVRQNIMRFKDGARRKKAEPFPCR